MRGKTNRKDKPSRPRSGAVTPWLVDVDVEQYQ
jgi:hypothetical protein